MAAQLLFLFVRRARSKKIFLTSGGMVSLLATGKHGFHFRKRFYVKRNAESEPESSYDPAVALSGDVYGHFG
jgi:hypothetical protein